MNAGIEDLTNCLFLDIETIGDKFKYDDLDEHFQYLWNKKSKRFAPKGQIESEIDYASLYANKAGIFAEFGRIVCISVGYFRIENQKLVFRLKSFYGDNEALLLSDFFKVLDKHFNNPIKHKIVGHNLREFDMPYMARRGVILGIPLPEMLNISGKKPWQISHIVDTMEMWRYGDYKNFTSLELLAGVLKIPTPKDDIDGSQVHSVYWEESGLVRIATYCEKDVETVAKVYIKLKGIKDADTYNLLSLSDFKSE